MTISDTAFALLEAHRSGKAPLSRRAGSFCGQLAVDPQPLTEKQANWLRKLLERADLPAIGEKANV